MRSAFCCPPGLTVFTGLAVLIPLTFRLDPLFALGMMAGGRTAALVSTPGAITLALLSAAILLTPAWRKWRTSV